MFKQFYVRELYMHDDTGTNGKSPRKVNLLLIAVQTCNTTVLNTKYVRVYYLKCEIT